MNIIIYFSKEENIMTNNTTTFTAAANNTISNIDILKKRYKFQKIAAIVALVCSFINFRGIFLGKDTPEALLYISIIAGFACYIVGGLKNVISFAAKATRMAWFAAPFFPMNLLVGVMGSILIIMVAIFLPFVAVLNCCQRSRNTLKEAGEI